MKQFTRFSNAVTRGTGSPWAFLTAFAIVLAWGATGPVFRFSDTWQLVINTGTTVVTFLMVFIIQHSQNKDTVALHVKIDELIRVHKAARNDLMGVEEKEEDEIRELKAAGLPPPPGGAGANEATKPEDKQDYRDSYKDVTGRYLWYEKRDQVDDRTEHENSE